VKIRSAAILVVILSLVAPSLFARRHSARTSMTVEIEGVITTVSSAEIDLKNERGQNVSVMITPDTIFRSGDMAITPADLNAGDRVEIQATQVNDVLNAVVVRLDREEQQPQTAEIEGVLTSIGMSEIVVTDAQMTDTTVEIDANTMIFIGGQPATLADLVTGQRVEVEATVSGTTTTAVIIHAEVPEMEQPEAEVQGAVSAVGTDSITVTTSGQGDVTVTVDANTRIRKDGQTIAIGDIQTGDAVEAKGTRVDAQTILASEITVESQTETEEAEVQGTVSAVGTDSITVTTSGQGDVTVNVDANTRIRKDDRTIAIGDIQKGDSVEAKGTRVDDHTILASEIEVRTSGDGGGNDGGGHH